MRLGIDNTNDKVFWPLSVILYFVYAGIALLFLTLGFAYLFNDKQATWEQFSLPSIFWVSTPLAAGISLVMHRQIRLYIAEDFKKLRRGYLYALLMGAGFILCQLLGWKLLYSRSVTLHGTPAAGYLYVLSGLHVIHVLAGVVMLAVALFRTATHTGNAIRRLLFFTDPIRKYRLLLLVHYWHTIDAVWIFLFAVFLIMHQ